jgi:ATP-binding cassette subfamily B (MDR/TAP) protein 9
MFQVPRTDALALKAPRTSIYVLTSVYHILLLGKAVVVAILSDEEPWPVDRYHSGLVCIYTGLVVAFVVTQFQQHVCMRAIDSLAKKKAMEVRASSLYQPLVADSEEHKDDGEEEVRHATILGLLGFAAPDTLLLTVAFLAGSLAALGQALIPYYTGKIIDYASIDPDRALFKYTIVKLLLVAFLCAIFTGIRGGLFTYAMTRMNVRLRMRLFSSLLRQDCGFYDRNRIGDITSRLSADTTTVSDQICLNLNVMMRSITQAAMVLVFMFKSSWRLSVVTFVMVPIVIIVCKVYGAYYRRMSKTVQARLAEANSVADESLSSISIVKSHAAEGSTESAYETKLREFYFIQVKQALAYSLYMINNTFLTAAVIAGVLFYGGTLVLNDAMSAGSLVSFMLYQQSLSASFQSLGDVFSALSAAVGAADKVIELINKPPAFIESGTEKPDRDLVGSIEFRNVSFSYPARPGITILENFYLSIRPGEVVALVGPSGGGKSSIVNLL